MLKIRQWRLLIIEWAHAIITFSFLHRPTPACIATSDFVLLRPNRYSSLSGDNSTADCAAGTQGTNRPQGAAGGGLKLSGGKFEHSSGVSSCVCCVNSNWDWVGTSYAWPLMRKATEVETKWDNNARINEKFAFMITPMLILSLFKESPTSLSQSSSMTLGEVSPINSSFCCWECENILLLEGRVDATGVVIVASIPSSSGDMAKFQQFNWHSKWTATTNPLWQPPPMMGMRCNQCSDEEKQNNGAGVWKNSLEQE